MLGEGQLLDWEEKKDYLRRCLLSKYFLKMNVLTVPCDGVVGRAFWAEQIQRPRGENVPGMCEALRVASGWHRVSEGERSRQ